METKLRGGISSFEIRRRSSLESMHRKAAIYSFNSVRQKRFQLVYRKRLENLTCKRGLFRRFEETRMKLNTE